MWPHTTPENPLPLGDPPTFPREWMVPLIPCPRVALQAQRHTSPFLDAAATTDMPATSSLGSSAAGAKISSQDARQHQPHQKVGGASGGSGAANAMSSGAEGLGGTHAAGAETEPAASDSAAERERQWEAWCEFFEAQDEASVDLQQAQAQLGAAVAAEAYGEVGGWAGRRENEWVEWVEWVERRWMANGGVCLNGSG